MDAGKKRLQFADAVKGFAIIGVVVYHLLAPCAFKTQFARFGELFVIMFFFYSGYFYKPGKKSILQNIGNRTKGLAVPFFKYSLFFWAVGSIWLILTKAETVKEAFACLRNFYIGCIWNRVIQDWFGFEYYSLGKRYFFLADFWYLISLWFASLFFFWFIDRILKSKIATVLTVIGLFTLTGVFCGFEISLPYNIHMVPFWLGFLILGAFCAQIKLFFLPIKTGGKAAIGIGATAICLIAAFAYPSASAFLYRGSFGENEFFGEIFCILTSLFGIWGISQIFTLLEEKNVRIKEIAWLGSHSLIFYLYHMFFAFIIGALTKFDVLYKEPLAQGALWKSILLTVAVFILCALRCVAEDLIVKKMNEKKASKEEKKQFDQKSMLFFLNSR